MSHIGQRPEHLVIREYLQELRDAKRITQEGLRDAFVPVYLEMIPPSEEAPSFEAVHRHDSADQLRRKDATNLKKLWRAIDGTTFFPIAFKAPLIVALDRLGDGLGLELQKRLLHNAGLFYLAIETSGRAPEAYAKWLAEFAEANTQIVKDLGDDGRINSKQTRREVMDTIEAGFAMLAELDRNEEAEHG